MGLALLAAVMEPKSVCFRPPHSGVSDRCWSSSSLHGPVLILRRLGSWFRFQAWVRVEAVEILVGVVGVGVGRGAAVAMSSVAFGARALRLQQWLWSGKGYFGHHQGA